MKPQFESYRYVGERCFAHSQSIVECRLPGGEISSVLAVHAKAVPTECTCGDGEAQYSGKLFLTVVYEDADRKICRIERGAEFFHKAENPAIVPACLAKCALKAETVNYRREGSGIYVSVVVGADVTVYGNKQLEYLIGGEDLIVKKEPLTLVKKICVTGETEGEDEFVSDCVGDILLHGENALVHHVSIGAGQIEVDGEISLNICVLKSDESVCSYERILPFRMQIPCDEAFGHITAGARVSVKSSHLTAGTDEEKGVSKILFTYTLTADCFLYVKEEILAALDAFSTSVETCVKKEKDGGRYLMSQSKYTERISGTAVVSPEIDGEYSLQAAVLPRAEVTVKQGERGREAEGAVFADLLLVGADGGHKNVELSLPFVFPIDGEGEITEADCIVCGLNVRRKRNGETEVEAVLKMLVRNYASCAWEYISAVEAGEEIKPNDCAFSVFLPVEGEDLWQVAKRLSCDVETLQKSNPDLKFPVEKGKKIYVYRQIE